LGASPILSVSVNSDLPPGPHAGAQEEKQPARNEEGCASAAPRSRRPARTRGRASATDRRRHGPTGGRDDPVAGDDRRPPAALVGPPQPWQTHHGCVNDTQALVVPRRLPQRRRRLPPVGDGGAMPPTPQSPRDRPSRRVGLPPGGRGVGRGNGGVDSRVPPAATGPSCRVRLPELRRRRLRRFGLTHIVLYRPFSNYSDTKVPTVATAIP